MSEVYKMTIAGLERELPLCPINENLSIGAFIVFGDVELTVAASAELLKKCPEFDYIITPEAKSKTTILINPIVTLLPMPFITNYSISIRQI